MATPQNDRQVLEFNDDPGASRSVWIAVLLLVLIVAWMGSGFVLPSEAPQAAEQDTAPQAIAVATRISVAAPVTLYFQAEGQAQPDRDTAIRTEVPGEVAEVLVTKGADVETDQVIARLVNDQAVADLNQARLELESAQREFDNASQLRDRGIATADRVVLARATLAAAQAQVTASEEALENAEIVAPFSGRIETLSLDEGEFVGAGVEVGRIVDNMPLTVALQVPQQALNQVNDGQSARVFFITGEALDGTVSFVGTSASTATRTFLAEIEVPNSDGAIPAGISAEVRIPTGQVSAHFIAPSIVSLSPSGDTGVKVVEDGVVRFLPIDVVRAEIDGIWVTGLPDQVELITVGQGFVRDGDAVRAQPETAGADVSGRLAEEASR